MSHAQATHAFATRTHTLLDSIRDHELRGTAIDYVWVLAFLYRRYSVTDGMIPLAVTWTRCKTCSSSILNVGLSKNLN